ncbi:sensor histidine kinase [Catenuloplanes japonicus]|uniref:sensor histidine kinase n=1 Tax=Catenuloplanes japonicus TaxID=33876 RepID=UPI00052586B8|nr:HAMP domain-containing sensor histidine kinase [Catenuloplanes japonicus]
MRSSLTARLLGLSLLVMLCTVTATTWLTVQSTTREVRQEYSQGFAGDGLIVDAVLEYAAENTTWTGVTPLLTNLSQYVDRQIVLTGTDGTFLASSDGTQPELPARELAPVDPLHAAGEGGGIDPRAVGPYRLTPEEQTLAAARINTATECMAGFGIDAAAVREGSGRFALTIRGAPTAQVADCYRTSGADAVTDKERAALRRLNDLTNACLGHADQPVVTVLPGFTWVLTAAAPAGLQPQRCIDDSRREQLRPYVAPPVQIYVIEQGTAPAVDLSRAGTLRIAGVSGLVLAAAFAVTLLVGLRLSRPLRALTRAVENGETRLPVRGGDEIGRLTAAFNDLSARRETVERQRRSMVSDIAHELGSPLTNIRAWLQAARDGVAEADRELLDLLADEAALLHHVIDDLRDLAAADAGRLRLHPEPVYVNELLGQVVVAHQGRADSITITLDADGDPEAVLDPTRVRQAVGNLVSNAVRYSPPGGTVTVRSRVDGDDLVIEVADAGSGIAEDDLPHVFERFWRADLSRSRHTGGSGLGLAIVRNLIEAHGGTVTATSRAGHGSTFTIRLPASLA